MIPRPHILLVTIVSLAGLALAGCGGSPDTMGPPTGMGARSSAPVALASAERGSLRITGGWVVATTPVTSATSASPTGGSSSVGSAMSAAYAVIENTGADDDDLVSVATPAAGDAQLHTTVENSAGAGTMKHVDAIAVPAHGSATLRMGGYHVMLMNLAGPLREGDRVTMTWTFGSGSSITTSLPVIAREHRPGG